jgi:murein DD-endopeptidase MepM/ murein hydrolase activator NlpD
MRKAAAATALALLLPAPGALAAGDPEVAALQVGLRSHGLYGGTVDGVLGGSTTAAVRRLQQKARIVVDGVPGPATRAALGRYGRRSPLGRRVLAPGMRGWDVAALQFSLAWHGFPSGRFDGVLGASTERALLKFQRWAGLQADGLAGAGAFRALKAPPPSCPIQLAAPLPMTYTDVFGPRGNRFHTGIDYPASRGTPVAAAGSGRVSYAGWSPTWGYLVTVAHAAGVRTMYAHLSRIGVRLGERVEVGERIGLVGSSGHATGPHLHFEVRLRGAAVDPLRALL